MTRLLPAVTAILLACTPLAGQESSDAWDPAIEDNSFFIEEAYNQEEDVVQHISNAVLTNSPVRTLAYSFTQEWPLFSHLHQLSVTVPYTWVDGTGSNGVGDILVNYRFQLADAGDWAAIAPRVSLVFASPGMYEEVRRGVPGLQFNLPASKRLTNKLVTHVNAGMTLGPELTSRDRLTAGTSSHTPTQFALGASLIWLAGGKTNVLIEYVSNIFDEQLSWSSWDRRTEHTVSAGVRQAIDIGSLQIVPGAALPLFISEGETHVGGFFYLSFEHPF